MQSVVGLTAFLICAGFVFALSEIKHPSTPLRIVAVVFGLLSLAGFLALGVGAAKVVRDWAWLRQQDWRDSRRRNDSA
jgi:hypothetical protein